MVYHMLQIPDMSMQVIHTNMHVEIRTELSINENRTHQNRGRGKNSGEQGTVRKEIEQ